MAGSIEKRGQESWRLIYSLGYDQHGKRIKRTKTVKCKTKSEAKKELAKFITEVEAGEYIAPEKMKFAAFIIEWEKKYAEKHLSPATITSYRTHLKNRIIPYFGHKNLSQIKPIDIVNFLEHLQEEGQRQDGKSGVLSSSSVEYNHRILRNIFSRAVEWQLIKKSPVETVKKPKRIQKETSVFSQKEATEVFTHLRKEKPMWRIMVILALTTGMRRGELLGLEWKNVDLEKGTIQIKQTLTYTNKQHIVKEPKTKNSIRMVSLPASLIEALKTYKHFTNKERMKAGDHWEGGNYYFLFSSWHGKPLHPSSVTTWWKRFINKNNLRYIRFHDLRHTSATLLINQGVHAKTISSRLGHADIRTTMNIYGHALQEADQEAANHFDSFFMNSASTNS
ncbi:tyrosine-type recombinase/integrase [Pseudalkalibacillus salsuginis]|uniref:tyrosine-type recombinase/integrase n=1 Tax=Pseudalkalibacillus salsuginis TaxID=2910972 RepID=UPI001F467FF6|nr:tyrosine-type recombinase/integrase [Pseudalkalibacillus salsuginis]MCF6409013.1 site-specific integrase [Pseudalkalibacillus salsuginis]